MVRPKAFMRAGRSLLALVSIAFAASPLAAATVEDEIFVTSGDAKFGHASLPNGPAAVKVPLTEVLLDLAMLPSGRLLALNNQYGYGLATLEEVKPDGSLVEIGRIDPLCVPGYSESLGALAADDRGRLFLLRYVYLLGGGDYMSFLTELDPATATTLETKRLEEVVNMLAPAPGGFWTRSEVDSGLHLLDPESGEIGPKVANMDDYLTVVDSDTDSSGRLWITETCGVCSPPFYRLSSFDPETDEDREEPVVSALFDYPLLGVAIRRRCIETPTSRCLQAGRFRAEVQFTDYAGSSGAAQVATGRSGDTGLFYFFDPANWELMVKVLDGCGKNGSFWVFASASTDVAFTLTVTDTRTGARKTYSNPLGQVARTVEDTAAFSCSP